MSFPMWMELIDMWLRLNSGGLDHLHFEDHAYRDEYDNDAEPFDVAKEVLGPWSSAQ